MNLSEKPIDVFVKLFYTKEMYDAASMSSRDFGILEAVTLTGNNALNLYSNPLIKNPDLYSKQAAKVFKEDFQKLYGVIIIDGIPYYVYLDSSDIKN